ncbi:basic salivary proline-rich protein 1-like [Prinia subflava]|uniref:basic salivary proline-rich protein 1-like n=1 Tax=Prinia subflava TaxID=208062 RepID=UPI002FE18101
MHYTHGRPEPAAAPGAGRAPSPPDPQGCGEAAEQGTLLWLRGRAATRRCRRGALRVKPRGTPDPPGCGHPHTPPGTLTRRRAPSHAGGHPHTPPGTLTRRRVPPRSWTDPGRAGRVLGRGPSPAAGPPLPSEARSPAQRQQPAHALPAGDTVTTAREQPRSTGESGPPPQAGPHEPEAAGAPPVRTPGGKRKPSEGPHYRGQPPGRSAKTEGSESPPRVRIAGDSPAGRGSGSPEAGPQCGREGAPSRVRTHRGRGLRSPLPARGRRDRPLPCHVTSAARPRPLAT